MIIKFHSSFFLNFNFETTKRTFKPIMITGKT